MRDPRGHVLATSSFIISRHATLSLDWIDLVEIITSRVSQRDRVVPADFNFVDMHFLEKMGRVHDTEYEPCPNNLLNTHDNRYSATRILLIICRLSVYICIYMA